MKRSFMVIALALALLMVFSSAALAYDPVAGITIYSSTDRLENWVNGLADSGNFSYNLNFLTPTHVADVTMTNMTNAMFNLESWGRDTTVCHPGAVGQENRFDAHGFGPANGNLPPAGDFTATYKSQSSGYYGILNSFVNAKSGAGGAYFGLSELMDFAIMSGNWSNTVNGNFYAYAGGSNDQVAMNLKSSGSMYVWSEASNGGVGLQGNSIGKSATIWQGTNMLGRLELDVNTDGLASIHNSAAWGWGISALGPVYTNYGGGTRTVTATGAGDYHQYGFGANELGFNGFALPGGGWQAQDGQFFNGMSGTYNMSAK